MKQALTFVPPVGSACECQLCVDTLDSAKELHYEGKYLQSILLFIDGLGRNLRSQYGDAVERKFSIPHGSVLINIELTDSEFYIYTDFLRLPVDSGKRVAMLRAVGELNSRRLMLARVVKSGDNLRIEYHCPLEQTHTYKLYGVVNNICYVADRYDDELCLKFGAERITVPQTKLYSAEEVDRIYDALQRTGRYAIDTAQELTKERNHMGAWLMMSTVFFQFIYYADPKGMLAVEVDKALTDLDDKLPTSEQVTRAIRLLEELMRRDKGELAKGLYEAHVLMTQKNRASLQDIQEGMEKGYEEATQSIQSGSYERVVLRLLHVIYRAYNHNIIPPQIDKTLVIALQATSDTSIDMAAHILYRAVDRIVKASSLESVEIVEEQSLWSKVRGLFKRFFN
ncbi:MAG: hypothetical protein Q4A61_00640 [Porphyromonadaceae bacterium]|nr:hypothetical protein [Porphyromonadaceae bacterium]